jgi:hypothetical protein
MKCFAAIAATSLLAGCASKPVCENKVTAFVMAQEFVKRELKAPATASFPLINADGISVLEGDGGPGKCEFTVMLYVDSQNSFGANIRTNFIVRLVPDDESGTNWTKKSVTALTL